MSAIFETFPEYSEMTKSTTPHQCGESEKSAYQQKIEKMKKKIRKLRKKQKKLLQRIAELQARNVAEEQRKSEEEFARGQSFFKVIGDAIQKALPDFSALIATIIAGIFTKKIVQSVKKQFVGAIVQ